MSDVVNRAAFSVYEAAILLDGCLSIEEGKLSRNDAAREVSRKLRSMAVCQGLIIGESYRSEAGIRSQMDKMNAALKGEYDSPYVPRVFRSIAEAYLASTGVYEKTLEKALSKTEARVDMKASPLMTQEAPLPLEIISTSSPGNEEMVSTPEDEKLANKYPVLFKRIYMSLRHLSMDYSCGVDASQVCSDIKRIGRVSDIELILSQASWSKSSGESKYRYSPGSILHETKLEKSTELQGEKPSLSEEACLQVSPIDNRNGFKDVLLDDLKLTKGRADALRRSGVRTLFDLVEFRNSGRLERVPGFGPKSVDMVEGILLNAESILASKSLLPHAEANSAEVLVVEAEGNSGAVASSDVSPAFPEGAIGGDDIAPSRDCERKRTANNRPEYKNVPLYELNLDRLIYVTLRGEGIITLYDLIGRFNADELPLSYSAIRGSYKDIASMLYGAESLPAVQLLLPDLEPLTEIEERADRQSSNEVSLQNPAGSSSAPNEAGEASLSETALLPALLDSGLSRVLQEECGPPEDEISGMIVSELADSEMKGINDLLEGSLRADAQDSTGYHLASASGGLSCAASIGSEGAKNVPFELLSEHMQQTAVLPLAEEPEAIEISASDPFDDEDDKNICVDAVDYQAIDVLQECNLRWPEPHKLENGLGEVVFILKEPHFRPYEAVDFTKTAEERYGASPYELSLSLFGIPLTGKSTKYTDDYIKRYLEDRIEKSEVEVPKTTEAPWYRGFLRRKHMSHEGLLALFGLNSVEEPVGEALFDEDGSVNESALPNPEELSINRLAELEALLDPVAAKKLVEEYGLTIKKLSKWLGTDTETLKYGMLENVGSSNWLSQKLSDDDIDNFMFLVERNMFSKEKNDRRYCILNNRNDSACLLHSNGAEIHVTELGDAPKLLADAIRSKGMERLTRKEVSAVAGGLGEYVEIVGEKHFRASKNKDFKELADARGMELDDYSRFLFGVPFCASKSVKTDADIRDFLEKHTVDGVTEIPSGNKGQWLRNIARKHGMTEEELICFYGFASASLPKSFSALSEEPDTAEADPGADPAKSLEESVRRAFQENALIGNALFSRELRERLNDKAKVLISRGMAGYSLTLEEKMAITLAASYCVKDWDEKKSNFWNFISIQFGYRSEGESGVSVKLRNLMCDCVEQSLTGNGRWFVSTETGRQFKATLLIHGMGPRNNWLHLCDFLYDFYKDNLCGIVMDNDSLIRRMVIALGSRMNRSSEAEGGIRISSKAYLFQEAIKKLVCSRPRYAAKMFERMIKRIDSIVTHTNTKAAKYEERLVDLWWEQRLQTSGEAEAPKSERGIALSRSTFKPSYFWDSDSDSLQISFPALRLEETGFENLELAYLVNDEVVERKKLRYHGNDLGKTMAGFSEDVGNSIRRGFANGLSIRVQILCDDTPIYDSGKSLFRKALIFKGGCEVKPELCKQGDYIIAGPKGSLLELGNAESSVIRDDQSLKAFFVELGEGFFVTLNERLLCSDNETENSSNPAIFIRSEWPDVRFVDDEAERVLVSQGAAVSIALPENANLESLQLTIGNFIIPWTSMERQEHANHAYYEFQLSQLDNGRVDVLIRDLSRAKVVGIKRLYLVSGLNYEFDKPYYFSNADYEGAKLTYDLNGRPGHAGFDSLAPAAQVLVDEGSLEFAIPAITLKDCADMTWGASFVEWAGNIQEDRALTTRHRGDCAVFLKVGSRNIAEEKGGVFPVGSAIRAIAETSAEKWVDISLCAVGGGNCIKTYPIGRIALKETFLEQPQFAVKDGVLKWNCGGRYIGSKDARLMIRIAGSEGDAYSCSLDVDSSIVSESVSVPDGVYQFEISKEPDDPFEALQAEVVAKGSFFVGNKDAYRFADSIIAIDATTFTQKDKVSNEDVGLGRIELEPVYIDSIEFVEMRQFEGSERAEYSGMLYYVANGSKHYYPSRAFVDVRGNARVKINPVRFIYLSDMAICMTDEEGDAPYCTRRKTADPFRIDSIENPSDKRPDYTILPDLFSYRKEAL